MKLTARDLLASRSRKLTSTCLHLLRHRCRCAVAASQGLDLAQSIRRLETDTLQPVGDVESEIHAIVDQVRMLSLKCLCDRLCARRNRAQRRGDVLQLGAKRFARRRTCADGHEAVQVILELPRAACAIFTVHARSLCPELVDWIVCSSPAVDKALGVDDARVKERWSGRGCARSFPDSHAVEHGRPPGWRVVARQVDNLGDFLPHGRDEAAICKHLGSLGDTRSRLTPCTRAARLPL